MQAIKELAGEFHPTRFGFCSLPVGQDAGNLVRSIVALQCHNNCGRLVQAARQAARAGGSASGDDDQSKSKSKSKSKGKDKKKNRKSKGAFGKGY
jgi:hypothetical protein